MPSALLVCSFCVSDAVEAVPSALLACSFCAVEAVPGALLVCSFCVSDAVEAVPRALHVCRSRVPGAVGGVPSALLVCSFCVPGTVEAVLGALLACSFCVSGAGVERREPRLQLRPDSSPICAPVRGAPAAARAALAEASRGQRHQAFEGRGWAHRRAADFSELCWLTSG